MCIRDRCGNKFPERWKEEIAVHNVKYRRRLNLRTFWLHKCKYCVSVWFWNLDFWTVYNVLVLINQSHTSRINICTINIKYFIAYRQIGNIQRINIADKVKEIHTVFDAYSFSAMADKACFVVAAVASTVCKYMNILRSETAVTHKIKCWRKCRKSSACDIDVYKRQELYLLNLNVTEREIFRR